MKKIIMVCCIAISSLACFGTKKVLVVSGGGAKGAWGGGFLETLSKKQGGYDIVIGTSTGALQSCMVLTNNFDKLYEGYTSFSEDSIFDKSPFKLNKHGKMDFKAFNAAKKLINKSESLAESNGLKSIIGKFITQHLYDSMRTILNKKMIVCVADYNTGKSKYISSDTVADVEQMKNWIWASCNEPIFMSPYVEENTRTRYYDGGIIDNVPLNEAISLVDKDQSITSIDVVIHNDKYIQNSNWNDTSSLLKSLLRTIDIMRYEIRKNDIERNEFLLESKYYKKAASDKAINPIVVNIYYMPDKMYSVIDFDLMFDQSKMKEAWRMGQEAFETGKYTHETFTVYREVLNAEKFQNLGLQSLIDGDIDGAQDNFNKAYEVYPTYKNVEEIKRLIDDEKKKSKPDVEKIYHEILTERKWGINPSILNDIKGKLIKD